MSGQTRSTVSWERLFDTAMDGQGVVDGETFERVNQTLIEQHGYDAASDLVGRSWRDLYGPAARTRIETDVLPRVRDGDPWRGRVTGRRADGTDLPQELSIRQLDDGPLVWTVRATDELEAESERSGGDRERSREEMERYRGELERYREELDRYRTFVETVRDGVYALDENLRFTYVNDALCEMLGRPRESLIGTSTMDLFADEDQAAAAHEMREAVVEGDGTTGSVTGTVERDDGETIHIESRYRLHPVTDGEYAGSFGVIRDVTDRVERERRLERQTEELETLAHVNELLREVTRELFDVPSRDALGAVVCEGLADSGFYRFAWIGDPTTDGSLVVPRVAAGEGDGYLDDLDVSVDEEDATGHGPVGRALRTGDVAVCRDVGSDPSFEPWRRAALERGFRSVAAVPLTSGDTSYGVLVVYASRPDGFSDHERAGLAVLGETIGFARKALSNRRLLFADAIVELEFRLADPSLALASVAAARGCTLSLGGYLAKNDGGWLVYLTVEGADVASVGDSLAAAGTVARTRVVRVDDDGGLLEVSFAPSAFFDTIADVGAKVSSLKFTDGIGRVVVEAPAATDVRDLVGRVQARYPEMKLLSRSQRDRSVDDVTLPSGTLGVLTDRQRQVLEAAFRAGYFSWPRASTAEEVATSLDIASPTFHAHVRKAEDRLFSHLLDDGH